LGGDAGVRVTFVGVVGVGGGPGRSSGCLRGMAGIPMWKMDGPLV